MNYIINLFGTGIRLWDCQIDKDQFDDMNTVRMKHNANWENLLFDFDFLKHYGYNHWSDLSTKSPQIGFLLNPYNIIEIKHSGKLVLRFKSVDLDFNQVLFPLYQTTLIKKENIHHPNEVQLKLIQFEKGLIAKYKYETEMFKIEEVSFNLDKIHSDIFLDSISVNSIQLNISQDDTVVIGTKIIH